MQNIEIINRRELLILGATIAIAVCNTAGVRVRDYPITLDKLLAGLPAQTGACPA